MLLRTCRCRSFQPGFTAIKLADIFPPQSGAGAPPRGVAARQTDCERGAWKLWRKVAMRQEETGPIAASSIWQGTHDVRTAPRRRPGHCTCADASGPGGDCRIWPPPPRGHGDDVPGRRSSSPHPPSCPPYPVAIFPLRSPRQVDRPFCVLTCHELMHSRAAGILFVF